MFVILVYDINEKRVTKVLKKCRQYLNWVQNSVFEGEITESGLFTLKEELKKITKKEEDSIIIYQFRTLAYFKREIMGLDKSNISQFL
jgi:CRISPR-associated protein Cas2